jgi:cobalt-zinc-cadmium efflux system protein
VSRAPDERPDEPESGRHHGHDEHARHEHGALRHSPIGRLAVAFGLTVSFMVVEAVVGFWSASRALLADASHMLGDTAALGLAIVAQRVAAQARTRERTYGFRRAEVLAAFVNGIVLAVLALWIFREAVERWQRPVPILGAPMLVTAALGFAVNITAAFVLARGATGKNTNTKAALFHVLSDALGSVGAIAAAALVLAFGWTAADTVASVVIGVLVLYGGWRLLRETTHVLMEGTPVEVDVAEVEATIRAVPGVVDVHDLHVWSISDGFDVMTVHVVVGPSHHGTPVVAAVRKAVREHHHIEHVTVQPEASAEPPLVSIDLGAAARRLE